MALTQQEEAWLDKLLESETNPNVQAPAIGLKFFVRVYRQLDKARDDIAQLQAGYLALDSRIDALENPPSP